MKKPNKAAKKKNASSPARAIHAHDPDEGTHAVGIWDLHVYIVPDGKFWFAQGLEIDHAAQGNTVAEAKKNFQEGLQALIDLHLRMDGDIDKLLAFAPHDILQEALRDRRTGSMKTYSQISFHDIGVVSSMELPFDGIRYLVAGAAA